MYSTPRNKRNIKYQYYTLKERKKGKTNLYKDKNKTLGSKNSSIIKPRPTLTETNLIDNFEYRETLQMGDPKGPKKSIVIHKSFRLSGEEICSETSPNKIAPQRTLLKKQQNIESYSQKKQQNIESYVQKKQQNIESYVQKKVPQLKSKPHEKEKINKYQTFTNKRAPISKVSTNSYIKVVNHGEQNPISRSQIKTINSERKNITSLNGVKPIDFRKKEIISRSKTENTKEPYSNKRNRVLSNSADKYDKNYQHFTQDVIDLDNYKYLETIHLLYKHLFDTKVRHRRRKENSMGYEKNKTYDAFRNKMDGLKSKIPDQRLQSTKTYQNATFDVSKRKMNGIPKNNQKNQVIKIYNKETFNAPRKKEINTYQQKTQKQFEIKNEKKEPNDAFKKKMDGMQKKTQKLLKSKTEQNKTYNGINSFKNNLMQKKAQIEKREKNENEKMNATMKNKEIIKNSRIEDGFHPPQLLFCPVHGYFIK